MGLVGVLPWYRFPRNADLKAVSESLDQVGMLKHANHSFADLSGGQRQRVLIARALVIDPVLLVLDEPTAGIDPQAEIIILDLLKTLHENGKTILMVSHRDQSLRQYVARVVEVKGNKVTEL
jgi:ABC-type Mn2+/Zn2+ transport system ATPase subunit